MYNRDVPIGILASGDNWIVLEKAPQGGDELSVTCLKGVEVGRSTRLSSVAEVRSTVLNILLAVSLRALNYMA